MAKWIWDEEAGKFKSEFEATGLAAFLAKAALKKGAPPLVDPDWSGLILFGATDEAAGAAL